MITLLVNMHDASLDGLSKFLSKPLAGFYRACLGRLSDGATTAHHGHQSRPIVALCHTVPTPRAG